jgi:ferritin-like metal-binding protein YciE
LEVIVPRDRNAAINSYISDMLSLEDHIEKAIQSQIKDLEDYPDVVTELKQLHRTIEHHISDLRMLSDRRNAGGVTEAVKRAGSAVAGVAAGVIDLFRTEGLPKNLRDDYTALSLATIGYVMLHTTGLTLDDQEVADLAQQHVNEYAQVMVRFNTIIPPAVIRYLGQEGLLVREDVLPEINRAVADGWRAAESAVMTGPETATVRNR